MSSHWTIKLFFTTVLCIAEFSAQEWNSTRINELESNDKAILRQEMFSAVRRGDIVGFRVAINKGGLTDEVIHKYVYSHSYEQRQYLQKKMNRKMWAIEKLFRDKLVYSPSEEFLKKNSNDGRIFRVTLIPETGLVSVLMLNLTAVGTWNKTISQEFTPLHSICNLPDVEPRIVKYVLDTGVDINERSMNNQAALDLAASAGNLPLVKYLVENGANPNAVFHAPINENCDFRANYLKLIKLFSSKDAEVPVGYTFSFSPLISAILEEEIDVVKYLLSVGADINEGKQGYIALFIPVRYGSSEMVEVLLQHGSDVNGKSFLGATALHMAADASRLEMAKILLKHGAYVNITDNSGWTPLHVAAFSSRNIGLIELLLESDAGLVHATTDRGFTPLNLAMARDNCGFLSCLSTALNKNFSMKEQLEFNDETKICIRDDHLDIAILLLNKGASVNHQDRALGWSALHWVAALGDKSVAQLLVENHGAAINIKSRMDMTPSETAKYFGKRDVYYYLETKASL